MKITLNQNQKNHQRMIFSFCVDNVHRHVEEHNFYHGFCHNVFHYDCLDICRDCGNHVHNYLCWYNVDWCVT